MRPTGLSAGMLSSQWSDRLAAAQTERGARRAVAGDPGTLHQRTALFFLMIALSVLLGTGAVLLGRRLASHWGNWNASVAAGTSFVTAVTVAMVFLPGISGTPRASPPR